MSEPTKSSRDKQPATTDTIVALIIGAALLLAMFWFAGSGMGFGAGWEVQIDPVTMPPSDVP